jgi:ABC-type multidrug transport system permease subunit
MTSHRPSPIVELTLSRLREFLREPEAIFWVFIFPLLLAAVLGFAFREKPPDKIPIGITAGPKAEATRSLLARSPALLPRVLPEGEARDALRTGRISLLVEPGSPPSFRFDETRPDSRIARLEAGDALQRAAGRADALSIREERVTEKGSRYIDFLVPGLVGLNLMGSGIWSIAFGVVTARSRRVLKRLLATPMRKSHYLLAQILSRLVFLFPEVAALLLFGWLIFGVSVRGSLALIALICVLGAVSFCGIGLLVASRVRTIEGASGLANLVMMPMWLLSGVFFSAERFPDAAQPLIRALPLTAINDALRAVINEGRGLTGIATQLAIIAAWGLVSFVVALKIFRWK